MTKTAGYNVGAERMRDLVGGTNETLFKSGLSFWGDVSHIKTDDAYERTRIIGKFRDAGIQKWPDERTLEDVIR